MKIDAIHNLATLNDMPAGTFFIAQNHHGSTFGMSMTDAAGGVGAILFTKAVKEGEPFPCLVSANYMQNALLLPLPGASVLPGLSQESLARPITDDEGPGELILAADKRFFRCTHRKEAFKYVDIENGALSDSPDSDVIHVRKWEILIPLKHSQTKTIFAFDGPKPIA